MCCVVGRPLMGRTEPLAECFMFKIRFKHCTVETRFMDARRLCPLGVSHVLLREERKHTTIDKVRSSGRYRGDLRVIFVIIASYDLRRQSAGGAF